MRVVSVIPARMWSKGTPAKNRAYFAETLACALALGGQVLVTTDDPVLMQEDHITVIPRPAHLEDGPVEQAIAHALTGIAADVVVVLQPSSPSKNRSVYAQAALDTLWRQPWASSVISVVPWVGEPPQKACYLRDGKLHIPPPQRRQDCAAAYRRDGTVYAVRAQYARQGDLYGPSPVPLLVTPAESVTVD